MTLLRKKFSGNARYVRRRPYRILKRMPQNCQKNQTEMGDTYAKRANIPTILCEEKTMKRSLFIASVAAALWIVPAQAETPLKRGAYLEQLNRGILSQPVKAIAVVQSA